jgi:hypothetical protein
VVQVVVGEDAAVAVLPAFGVQPGNQAGIVKVAGRRVSEVMERVRGVWILEFYDRQMTLRFGLHTN